MANISAETTPAPKRVRLEILTEADVLAARRTARELAMHVGFRDSELTIIATAVSEITRNIVSYAGRGEIVFETINGPMRHGISVIARDDGPGIGDLSLAMQDGYSTGRSLGLGLPGARRLMDDFEIVSTPGEGTTVTMRKWVK